MSSNNGGELPAGWVWTSLDTITRVLESGGRPKGGVKGINEGIPSIGGEHLAEFGGFRWENIRFIPENFFQSMNKGIIEQGDVLIVKDGATTGKTSIVRDDFPHHKAAVNEHVFRWRGYDSVTAHEFIFYFLYSKRGQNQILDKFQGTAQGGINMGFVNDFPIPIPPLPEQHRIVARIKSLFQEVKTARQSLEKVQPIIKKFRQSVLASAFSEYYHDNFMIDIEENDRALMRASDICESIQCGSTPDKIHFIESPGIPFLKVYNIVNQEIDFIKKPQYIDSITHEGKLKRSIVKPGDVLMNIVGPPLGKVALVPITYPEWNINQAIVLFRSSPSLDSKYLYYLLRSECPYRNILKETRGSAGQANISLTQCRNMPIAVPPLPEQHRIVAKIEQLFALAEQAEFALEKARKRADRMEQAILAKAFRGELVGQNPEDEPASELMERIRKEREKGKKTIGSNKKVNKLKVETYQDLTLNEILINSKVKLTATELWELSGLKIDEFYTVLDKEIKSGRIIEKRTRNKEAYLEVGR